MGRRNVMHIPWFELILLAFLTVLNAFFTGSEIAFVSLREGQLQRLDEEGPVLGEAGLVFVRRDAFAK